PGAWCAALEDRDLDHRAQRLDGDYHRCDARRRTRGRRDRAAALYRLWQPLLELGPAAANRRAAAADLRLRHLAVPRLASPGVGRRAGAGGAGAPALDPGPSRRCALPARRALNLKGCPWHERTIAQIEQPSAAAEP